MYALLLAVSIGIRPWTVSLLLDFGFLAAYLTLCHQRGWAALRGEGHGHPVVDTLLWVSPIALVLSCHFVAAPHPMALLAALVSVPLSIVISFSWRKRRNRARPLEGCCLLLAPILAATLLGALFRGAGGGVYLIATNWLDLSFGYAGSGATWAISAAAAGSIAWLTISKGALGLRWPEAVLGSLVVVYLMGGYLLFFVYYALPLDHTVDDVAAQPHTEILPFPTARGPGRAIWVDPDEQNLLLSVKSTYLGADSAASGLSSYDLRSHRERHFVPMTAPCIEMIVDAERGVVHSCEFYTRSLRNFDLHTLDPMGVRVLGESARPEALVRLDERYDMIRFEVPGRGPPLARLDNETGEISPIWIPERWGVVGSYAITLDRKRKKIFFPSAGSGLTVLNRLDWNGRFEASVDLPGISFESHYSEKHDAVFVALLNRDGLYRVDPETLEFHKTPVPNGARAVRETAEGILVLGDYLRGKIYLYDPTTETILTTLLVGSKPQAIRVALPSGNLYVHSSFGLTRFRLSAILGELR
jgi:streptogramin lyase